MIKKIFVLMTVIFILSNCRIGHAGGPWKGKIVDVETKEPLEGTVVLAVWNRVYLTPYGSSSYFYEAKETVTNKNGDFEIASYTPINILPIISHMEGPYFTIFKPGYGSVNGQAIGVCFTGETNEVAAFQLEGKRYRYENGIVGLPKLKNKDERTKSLNDVEGYPIGYAPTYKIKHLLQFIDLENKDLGFKQ